MLLQENINITKEELPSFSTYRNACSKKSLSFHTPKKDQCSLCMTYTKGEETVKAKFKERYDKHIQQKNQVRVLKTKSKIQSKTLFRQPFLIYNK